MRLSVYGIPAGLVIGFFIGKGIVPLIIDMSSYQEGVVNTSLNPFIFIGAALFSLFTVYISTRKPGKIAASISPVEAVKYTDISADVKKEKKKNPRMAVNYIRWLFPIWEETERGRCLSLFLFPSASFCLTAW